MTLERAELIDMLARTGPTGERVAARLLANSNPFPGLSFVKAPTRRVRRYARRAVAAVAAVAVAVALTVGLLVILGARGVCPSDDGGTSCVWVGPLMGDGRGAWLIVYGPDADAPPVVYVDPRSTRR